MCQGEAVAAWPAGLRASLGGCRHLAGVSPLMYGIYLRCRAAVPENRGGAGRRAVPCAVRPTRRALAAAGGARRGRCDSFGRASVAMAPPGVERRRVHDDGGGRERGAPPCGRERAP